MDKFKDKKIIGLIILLVIIVSLSVITYLKNKKNVFKDEYKDNIFVEESNDETEKEAEKEEVKSKEKNNSTSKEKPDKVNDIVVEIKGEVLKPDVYVVNEGSIVKDLIDKAGGLTQNASVEEINRAEELHNHELVIIANKNDINNGAGQSEKAVSNNGENNTLININTATEEELQKIPGIGPSKAAGIISYREENGDFKNIEDIMQVSGIGEKSFAKIKDKITL